MQVDRHAELLGALVDRPELLVVEEHAVGEPVQHRALEAELRDAALELVGRRRRIGGRQRREAGEARRIGLDGLVQPVVDAARQLGRDVLAELLGRGRAVRQHLDVDPGFIHLLQAHAAQVLQALERSRLRGSRRGRCRCFANSASEIMLFQRDHRTIRFLQHGAFLVWLHEWRRDGGRRGSLAGAPQRRCTNNELSPPDVPGK